VRHAQRQPDLVGGASSLGVGTSAEERGGGPSPESESGSPESVHGDGLTLEVVVKVFSKLGLVAMRFARLPIPKV
jgi:hypothetical protein